LRITVLMSKILEELRRSRSGLHNFRRILGFLWSLTVFRFINFLELFIPKNEIQILIQFLIFGPFYRTLSKLLKAIHFSRILKRMTPVRLLPHLFYLLSKIKINRKGHFLELLRNSTPAFEVILRLSIPSLTITFLLYSL
jgi:accessory gene regulator protein AgrB